MEVEWMILPQLIWYGQDLEVSISGKFSLQSKDGSSTRSNGSFSLAAWWRAREWRALRNSVLMSMHHATDTADILGIDQVEGSDISFKHILKLKHKISKGLAMTFAGCTVPQEEVRQLLEDEDLYCCRALASLQELSDELHKEMRSDLKEMKFEQLQVVRLSRKIHKTHLFTLLNSHVFFLFDGSACPERLQPKNIGWFILRYI